MIAGRNRVYTQPTVYTHNDKSVTVNISLIQEILMSFPEYITGARIIFEIRMYSVRALSKIPMTALGMYDDFFYEWRNILLNLFSM
jgi:hypothetical protein